MKQPKVDPSPPMMITMKISTLTCAPICGITFCWKHAPHHPAEPPASAEPTTNTPTNSVRMRVAETLDHLAVLHAGPRTRQADLGAVSARTGISTRTSGTDRQCEHAIFADCSIADQQRSAQGASGNGNGRCSGPQTNLDQFLADDHAAQS